MGLELQYYCWQFAAYVKARALHRRIRFNVGHHVTYGRYWMPSVIGFLPVPFVWGPVGGGESAPRSFWRGLGLRGAALEAVREWARFLGEHDPSVRATARRATLALATTPETRERMKKLGPCRTELLPNVSLTEEELAELRRSQMPRGTPVRFISIGRLLAWKGFHLGVRAFARMRDSEAEYWIIGSGPEQQSLRALASDLGVRDRVRFLGLLPRQQVLSALAQCHVLVHPSLHDSSGTVCVEAMAAGRPVVCLDLGGPTVLVTPECGLKVPAADPEAAVAGLEEAMSRLVASEDLRNQMGRAGRKRANLDFNARVRGEQFSQFYAEVTTGRRGVLAGAGAVASAAQFG